MTLKTQIENFASAVGADIKALQKKDVQFAERLDVLERQTQNAGGIDDNTPSNETSYSSNKVNALLTAQKEQLTQQIAQSGQAIKHEILDGADDAYDTLKEIADYIAQDKSTAVSLANSIASRVRFDEAQALTKEQQVQACQNIGIGDIDTDFVAIYNQAKS